MPPPPDRGKEPKRQVQPLNFVRGGSVCTSGGTGGHLVKGSNKAAVCMPTVGSDTRSRWREAGRPVTPPSRHSLHFLQHRQGGGKR
jgi:hypothetical protein